MAKQPDNLNRLAPCIYTGLKTVWRRKDGAPALAEGGLRSALEHDPPALAAALKDGPGVSCKPVTSDTDEPKAKRPRS